MTPIQRFTMDTVGAIWKLIEDESHYLQALIVLYTAIDTLAWVDKENGNVTRRDFCNWVVKYMDPETNLGCTAMDLYGARCGLLHTGTPNSTSKRRGEAAELWYVTSPAKLVELEDLAKAAGQPVKVIHFTSLLAVYIEASENFNIDIEQDDERQAAINQRVSRWIRFR